MVTEINKTLEARNYTYGDFTDNAGVAQRIKLALHSGLQWDLLSAAQKEALEMIASKMSRIVTGNPMYKDSWTDIIGYATLVEKELK